MHTDFKWTLHAAKKNSKVNNNPFVWLNIGKGVKGPEVKGHVTYYHPYKTSCVEGEIEPVWNQDKLCNCEFDIEDFRFEEGLDIKVYDQNLSKGNVLIGECKLNLHRMESRIGETVEFLSYLKDSHLSGTDSVKTTGRVKITCKAIPYKLHDLTGIETYQGNYAHDHEYGRGKFTFKEGTHADVIYDEAGVCVSCIKYMEKDGPNQLEMAGADTGEDYGVAAYAAMAPTSEKSLLSHWFHTSHDNNDIEGSHKRAHDELKEKGIKSDHSFTPLSMMNYMAELKKSSNSVFHVGHNLGYEPDTLSTNSGYKSIVKEHQIIHLMHGRGKYRYPNGDFYEGDFKDDLRDGYGSYIYANGDKYAGQWANDYKDGTGTMVFTNGDHYEGQWRFNKRHGRGKLTFKNGQVYEGYYRDDQRCGYGVMKYPSGDVYAGHWKTNMKHRFGVFKYVNGDMYIGEFKNNLRHGQGKFVRHLEPSYKPYPIGTICFYSNDFTPGNDPPNLAKEGSSGWYSRSENDNSIVIMKLEPPQKIHRYSLTSGNESSGRNPKAWEIWGLPLDAKKMELLHQVEDKFNGTLSTKSFLIENTGDTLYKILEFRCVAVEKRGSGCQLSKIKLEFLTTGEYYEGEYKDDLPNGFGVYQSPEGVVTEAHFENGEPYVEDDAKICGEGGLFDPAGVYSSITDVPSCDKFGIDTPQFCLDFLQHLYELIDHFFDELHTGEHHALAAAVHPRRVLAYPRGSCPSTMPASPTESKIVSPHMSPHDSTASSPPEGGGRIKHRIIPRPTSAPDYSSPEVMQPKPNVMVASSEGMHTQEPIGKSLKPIGAPGLLETATEAPISINISIIDNKTAATEEHSREEEGSVVIKEGEGETSYYVENGLRHALSAPDENGYRHDMLDDEEEGMFDFIFYMLQWKKPRPKYFVRGTIVQEDLLLPEDPPDQKTMGELANSTGESEGKFSEESRVDTPLKTFGSLFAFSKTQKAKQTEVTFKTDMTSLSGTIEEAPHTPSRAATAPPIPTEGKLGAFTSALRRAKNPPPPQNNAHILTLDRDFRQESQYVPEPVGVIAGSSKEVSSSRNTPRYENESTPLFDWTFGFGSNAEETKSEPVDEGTKAAFTMTVSSHDQSPTVDATIPSSSSLSNYSQPSDEIILDSSQLDTGLSSYKHMGQLPHAARAVPAQQRRLNTSVSKNNPFMKKKDGKVSTSQQMYKPTKDSNRPASKETSLPGWFGWLPQCN